MVQQTGDRARGRLGSRLVVSLLFALLVIAVSAARADAAPVPVIIDTDMFSDADDAGAMATAYGLQYRGEAKVIATVVNTRTSRPAVSTNAWRCVEAINAFYGSASVPVGTSMPNNGSSSGDGGFAGSCGDLAPSFKAPDTALNVYRRALAGAADGSVVIASVGYMKNLSVLLNSPADGISALTGRQLIAQKVKMLVAMGGGYPSRGGETNLSGDPASAQNVANSWPTKIVWSGFEVGNTVYTGQTLSSVHPAGSPVRQAYEAFTQEPGTAISSWDLTAVYHAVRPADAILREVGPGKNTVSSDGSNSFTSGTGNQYYLVKSDSAAVAQAIETQLDTLGPPPDTTPPSVSGVGAGSVSETGATVAWTTDEPSTSQVEYGTSTAYGSATTLNSSMTSAHSQVLSGLRRNTTYHYRVKSRDAGGNLATSPDFTFTTPDTTPPVISGVSSTSGGAVSWTTDEPATSQVEYGTTSAYGSATTPATTRTTSHSQTVGGLQSGTTYHYRVRSTDAAGNTATSPDFTFTTPDTVPPVISGVSSTSGGAVLWTTDEPASSQVEYGTTVLYGSSTTIDMTPTTAHNQTLSGLKSGTTYHYRVTSTDAAGNTATSPDLTFTTPDTVPPVISGVSVSGSTVSWTTDEPSTSQVEYGTTTAYGSSTTLDTARTTSHGQTLSGLNSGTTYHYRVRSTDAAANTATSTDLTFTTADTEPPVISGVSATSGGAVSWTTDEPATTQVEYGTTSAYGSATTLDATRSTSHAQALSGLRSGTTYHYRVRSTDAVGNTAMSGDRTFATPDTVPPVISGVAVSGSTVSWTTDEAATSQVEYGTTTAYGSATALDATRATDHGQTLSGLRSSTTYHYRVKSTDAAGNAATSPDLTFMTPDTAAPVITEVTDAGSTVSWTTDEPATSQVEYGATSAYGSTTTVDGTLTTAHSQTLPGLAADTTYHYRVKSTDAAGNASTSPDFTLTTPPPPDTTAPSITTVRAGSITPNGATISWATDEAASSQVQYGTTSAYGSSTTLDATRATAHSQGLSGLAAGTTYHYRVKSTDAAGNTAASADLTFTTAPPPDTSPPVISGVSSTSAGTVSWTTDEPATSQVEYGTTAAYGSSTTLDTARATSHSQGLGGLRAATTYHYRVKSADAAGNASPSADFTFTTPPPPDTTPPAISAVTITGSTVTWSTDEPATSQVEYGTTSGYGSSTAADSARTTDHSQTLDGLDPSTTYHVRVKSTDAAGNPATSADFTFTTPDTVAPVISAISVSGSTVSWSTDEAATSQVEYGTTSAYGSATALDGTRSTSHSQALSGLAAGTTYHYRVKSTDAAGNVAGSPDRTFTTDAPPPPPPPAEPARQATTTEPSSTPAETAAPQTGLGALPAQSAGAPGCVVPSLKGRSLHGARTLLARHRCTLGRVTLARRSQRKRVVSQSLEPQTRRPRGYRVSIILR